ncbi:peptidoglycan-binding domain-containing protein [Agromyces salentinus]|uniref:Peptidoglycan-binding domain-containing protein n=1 Tax=Agromyces salentinus TaxID=269421 RepID=A0ABN2MGV3_9MICO|nr:peptidoglycan-binding domain-containing protein [Agromyces salentinus]
MKFTKFTSATRSRWAKRITATMLAVGMLFGLGLVAAPAANAANGGYCSKLIMNWGAGDRWWNTPADSNFNELCRLDQGANSIAVKALQQGLNGACAVRAGLAVDGVFGPATRSALIRAQQKFGVTADGIYGPNTARAFWWTDGSGGCHRISV